MIQQAYEYVSLRLWDHLMFFELNITKIDGYWKRVSCHGNITFIVVGVLPLEVLAYQVSMACDAIDEDSSIDMLRIILG